MEQYKSLRVKPETFNKMIKFLHKYECNTQDEAVLRALELAEKYEELEKP